MPGQLRVEVEEEAIAVSGQGSADAMVARRRADGREIRVPAEAAGGTWTARVGLEPLLREADGAESDLWDLHAARGEALERLGFPDEGVKRKETMIFPSRVVGERRVRPYYTGTNHLAISCRRLDAADEPEDDDDDEEERRPPKAAEVPEATLRAHRRLARAAGLWLRRGRPRNRHRRPATTADPKVHILLMNAWGLGGTIRTTLNLAGHLARTREVEIVSIVRRDRRPFFPFPEGVEVRAVDDQREDAPEIGGLRGRIHQRWRERPSRLLNPTDTNLAGHVSLWTDVRLVRRLRRIRSGIVISTRPGLNVLAAEVARPGVVVVGEEHMHFGHHPERRQEAIRAMYPHLDALAVLTDADRRDYRELLPEATPVVRIPNAVPPLPGGASALTEPVLVAAGRLSYQKGFDRLLGAMTHVAREEPGWMLRICGSGPNERRLRRRVVRLGLSNQVQLLGDVKRIEEQMAAASMFLLSSRFEGLPMVMIEAMSKGLPIVSFDCPTGPGEVLEDGVDGILVPDGDEEALGRAIVELIRDDERRRRMGAAAMEKARSYSIEAIGPIWDELLAGFAE